VQDDELFNTRTPNKHYHFKTATAVEDKSKQLKLQGIFLQQAFAG
jgi:hypothetical protein